jgi:hypothetical protein
MGISLQSSAAILIRHIRFLEIFLANRFPISDIHVRIIPAGLFIEPNGF